MDTAPDIQALARELGIERTLLYRWRRRYMKGGAAALRSSGRPRSVLIRLSETGLAAEETPAAVPGPAPVLAAHDPRTTTCRIAELERKIGQQALELDFFRAALRHVREPRR